MAHERVRNRNIHQIRSLKHMVEDLETLDMHNVVRARIWDDFPAAWHRAHEKAPCARTKKPMTIRLDPEVLEWYRSLGNGYQARMNEVLRAYMHSVISKWIEQPEDTDLRGNPL